MAMKMLGVATAACLASTGSGSYADNVQEWGMPSPQSLQETCAQAVRAVAASARMSPPGAVYIGFSSERSLETLLPSPGQNGECGDSGER